MKRYVAIGIAVVAVVIIGILSGFLISTNSELGQTRNALSFQKQTDTAASSAADATQERQFGLSTEAVSTLTAENQQLDSSRSTLEALNIELNEENANLKILQNAAYCNLPFPKVDFTSNETVSKALVEWVSHDDGPNLIADWQLIWRNSDAAIHRIYGDYLWVYIVTFNDGIASRDSILDLQQQCFLYLESWK
ncbi:MAG: hypothetical protein JW929_08985 [Anaerolineales bacterium]|nr:hypothetical protein [Anaerolineales bacterium]